MTEASRQIQPSNTAPYRKVRLGRPAMDVERRANGTIYIRSREQLGDYPVRLTDRLLHWAERTPDRTFIAARDTDGGWRKISYGETLAYARSIGEALLSRGLSAERPVVILSSSRRRSPGSGAARSGTAGVPTPATHAFSATRAVSRLRTWAT